MFKKFSLFLVLFSLTSFDALAIFEIEPANPTVGEPVRLFYTGCEPPFAHFESGELFYTERSESLVQFVGFYTFSLPICPIWYEEYYEIGVFEEGEYVLEGYLALALEELPLDLDNRTPNEILNFTVSGAVEPVSVPFMEISGLFCLMVILLLSAFLIQRNESL